MTRPDTRSPSGAAPARKATLYCDCGHASPVDGDWEARERDGVRRYLCPDCGATIATRPAPDADSDSGSDPDPVAVAGEGRIDGGTRCSSGPASLVRSWTDAWSRLLRPWLMP